MKRIILSFNRSPPLLSKVLNFYLPRKQFQGTTYSYTGLASRVVYWYLIEIDLKTSSLIFAERHLANRCKIEVVWGPRQKERGPTPKNSGLEGPKTPNFRRRKGRKS